MEQKKGISCVKDGQRRLPAQEKRAFQRLTFGTGREASQHWAPGPQSFQSLAPIAVVRTPFSSGAPAIIAPSVTERLTPMSVPGRLVSTGPSIGLESWMVLSSTKTGSGES